MASRLGKVERALYIVASFLFLTSAGITFFDYMSISEEPHSALNLVYAAGILVIGFFFFKLGTRREKK
ncbi:MAG TPA: hypothetical protein VGE59_00690 [Patescibacteria group bacterium]